MDRDGRTDVRACPGVGGPASAAASDECDDQMVGGEARGGAQAGGGVGPIGRPSISPQDGGGSGGRPGAGHRLQQPHVGVGGVVAGRVGSGVDGIELSDRDSLWGRG